ncbi:hypothetical protein HEK616_84160 (plasmid) [Streptomyces nigrescens]|uniref:Uncharacterized protein n=1 Tax=Streptomyces nigrescens TaxID=1920 RepID=A0ABN6RE83_STRNI|nr:hypothetical protein HEK616_84160 [Streptomyces nigrescens]
MGRLGDQELSETDRDGSPPVADPETGEIRVLKDRCTTCVLNPAESAAPLAPGRLKQFVTETREADGHIICHSTLSPCAAEGTPAAMCRGFVDAYGLPTAAQLAIRAGFGNLVEYHLTVDGAMRRVAGDA